MQETLLSILILKVINTNRLLHMNWISHKQMALDGWETATAIRVWKKEEETELQDAEGYFLGDLCRVQPRAAVEHQHESSPQHGDVCGHHHLEVPHP